MQKKPLSISEPQQRQTGRFSSLTCAFAAPKLKPCDKWYSIRSAFFSTHPLSLHELQTLRYPSSENSFPHEEHTDGLQSAHQPVVSLSCANSPQFGHTSKSARKVGRSWAKVGSLFPNPLQSELRGFAQKVSNGLRYLCCVAMNYRNWS